MKRLFSLPSRFESGQAMIFFALMSGVLMLTLGLAVEGGKMFVDYRRIQSAADMAALVGAQDLPSSDSSAITDACTYAFKNLGFSSPSCSSNPTTMSNGDYSYQVTSYVPPQVCSPYDFVPYQNGKMPYNGCSGTADTGNHFFIETQILATTQLPIPIFNKSVSLYAHAIARHGGANPRDYAIAVLDPLGCDLDLSGSQKGGTITVVGSVISNSTDSCSIKTGGQGDASACDGTWSVAAAETYPGNLDTYTGSKPEFAPPRCDSGTASPPQQATADASPSYNAGVAPIPDPYCSSYNPPTISNTVSDCMGNTATETMPNCTSCSNIGWIYQWDGTASGRFSGTWIKADSNAAKTLNAGNSYEFFPGLFPNSISISGSSTHVYFNPGVYTIETDFKFNGGWVCVYGAPACDDNLASHSGYSGDDCSTANFEGSTNLVDPNVWYYYCSPWGEWDTHTNLPSVPSDASHPAPQTTAPTFDNGTTPLNGVTFYVTGGAFNMSGGTSGSSKMFLAFPNYCPGTSTSAGGDSMPFPQVWGTGLASGDPNGQYDYKNNNSLPYVDSKSTTDLKAPAGQLYPSVDLTISGECSPAYNVWPGEFGPTETDVNGLPKTEPSQHLHFLVFARSSSTTIDFGGTGDQEWWGILYNPGSPPLPTAGNAGCGTSCQITLAGNLSSTTPTGPPMLIGQMIADNIKFTGNATAMVFYRPCTLSGSCGTGPGSKLVQ